ncbi:MAG: hypothetical protein ACRC92_21770 [Peptostreptococcaceae bacterium]
MATQHTAEIQLKLNSNLAEFIKQTNTQLAEMKKIVSEIKGSVMELVSAFKQLNATKFGDDFKTSRADLRAMNTQLKGIVNNTKRAQLKMQSLAKDMRKTGDVANSTGKSFSTFKTILGGFGILSIASVLRDMARALVQFGKDSITSASDMQEAQNVFDVVYKNNLAGAKKLQKQMEQTYGISTNVYAQNVANLGAMMVQLGVDTELAMKYANRSFVSAIDIASAYNMEFEEALEKVRSGIAGVSKPLQIVGIDVSVEGMKKFAENIGLVWTELDRGSQSMLREYKIYQDIQKSGVSGDFLRTSDQYANSLKQVGEIWTKVKNAFGLEMMKALEDVFRLIKENQDTIISFAEKFGMALGKVLKFGTLFLTLLLKIHEVFTNNPIMDSFSVLPSNQIFKMFSFLEKFMNLDNKDLKKKIEIEYPNLLNLEKYNIEKEGKITNKDKITKKAKENISRIYRKYGDEELKSLDKRAIEVMRERGIQVVDGINTIFDNSLTKMLEELTYNLDKNRMIAIQNIIDSYNRDISKLQKGMDVESLSMRFLGTDELETRVKILQKIDDYLMQMLTTGGEHAVLTDAFQDMLVRRSIEENKIIELRNQQGYEKEAQDIEKRRVEQLKTLRNQQKSLMVEIEKDGKSSAESDLDMRITKMLGDPADIVGAYLSRVSSTISNFKKIIVDDGLITNKEYDSYQNLIGVQTQFLAMQEQQAEQLQKLSELQGKLSQAQEQRMAMEEDYRKAEEEASKKLMSDLMLQLKIARAKGNGNMREYYSLKAEESKRKEETLLSGLETLLTREVKKNPDYRDTLKNATDLEFAKELLDTKTKPVINLPPISLVVPDDLFKNYGVGVDNAKIKELEDKLALYDKAIEDTKKQQVVEMENKLKDNGYYDIKEGFQPEPLKQIFGQGGILERYKEDVVGFAENVKNLNSATLNLKVATDNIDKTTKNIDKGDTTIINKEMLKDTDSFGQKFFKGLLNSILNIVAGTPVQASDDMPKKLDMSSLKNDTQNLSSVKLQNNLGIAGTYADYITQNFGALESTVKKLNDVANIKPDRLLDMPMLTYIPTKVDTPKKPQNTAQKEFEALSKPTFGTSFSDVPKIAEKEAKKVVTNIMGQIDDEYNNLIQGNVQNAVDKVKAETFDTVKKAIDKETKKEDLLKGEDIKQNINLDEISQLKVQIAKLNSKGAEQQKEIQKLRKDLLRSSDVKGQQAVLDKGGYVGDMDKDGKVTITEGTEQKATTTLIDNMKNLSNAVIDETNVKTIQNENTIKGIELTNKQNEITEEFIRKSEKYYNSIDNFIESMAGIGDVVSNFGSMLGIESLDTVGGDLGRFSSSFRSLTDSFFSSVKYATDKQEKILNPLTGQLENRTNGALAEDMKKSFGGFLEGLNKMDWTEFFKGDFARGLAVTVGTLLGGLVGGNSKESSIGSGIGGMLGDALGGSKWLTGLLGISSGGIGSAVLPVVGSILGSTLGGAIGGLFGGNKAKNEERRKRAEEQMQKNTQAITELTSMLDKFQSAMVNLLTGLVTNIAKIPTLSNIAKAEKTFDYIGEAFKSKDLQPLSIQAEYKKKSGWFGGTKRSYNIENITPDDMMGYFGLGGKFKDLSVTDLKYFKDRVASLGDSDFKNLLAQEGVKDPHRVGSTNKDTFLTQLESYIETIEKLTQAQKDFSKEVWMTSFEGVNIQDAKKLREEYQQLYKDFGLDPENYSKEIEEMVQANKVLITITQDLRSSFIDAFASGENAGTSFVNSLTVVFDALRKNISSVVYGTVFDKANSQIEQMFKNMVDELATGKIPDMSTYALMIANIVKESEKIDGTIGDYFKKLKDELVRMGIDVNIVDSILGLDKIDTLTTSIRDSLKEGIKEGLEANDISLATKSIGDAIREHVTDALIDSFVKSFVAQGQFDKYLKDIDFSNMSFEEAFKKMQEVLGQLDVELNVGGIGQATTNKTQTDLTSKVESETQGATITNTYNQYIMNLDGYTSTQTIEQLMDMLEDKGFVRVDNDRI